ncbi:MAG: hypothetical protein A3I29_01345 [Candidatus Magasanikbacteria bacterium RIFCSPLOWO2_02_FULL_44_11]|uniref:Uncharacterized protein n=1 Tax=Candidatus Magasanikbacteria bacterium RIFCSPLOWO2_02_FULL_44_11 TaxID=1798689 RepID=A0A1F6NA51_9BACT|nr:MAG: hypothetical protein A3I29_01345 [Candidatus Magasanikbacteria bacterium RIFCSPLOWO2_02_FULL_44_11]
MDLTTVEHKCLPDGSGFSKADRERLFTLLESIVALLIRIEQELVLLNGQFRSERHLGILGKEDSNKD